MNEFFNERIHALETAGARQAMIRKPQLSRSASNA